MTNRTASVIAAELAGVNAQVDALKGRARALAAELREADARQAAAATVAKLTREERAALAEQLQATEG